MVDLTKFKKPNSEYGIHPFWFWNGDMSNEEIARQIFEMADKGITGFFICPRQGLSIPYLSNMWFEKVNLAINEARKYDMDVWLYDEYPYPSGMAGGEVILQHPDAKQRILNYHTEEIWGDNRTKIVLPWGRILFAKVVPIDPLMERLDWKKAVDVKEFIGNLQIEPVFQKAGLTSYNQKRYFTYGPRNVLDWIPPSGRWELHAFIETEIKDFKYYGTYVDPCHSEAMSTFIQITHDLYAKKIGRHFGKTVKGMFTDETHLLGRFPWSSQLINFIQERHGYDIRDHLHLLIHCDGNRSAKVRYDYYQAIHLLLRKSYHKQMHDWCNHYELKYVAEVPSARMSTQIYSHIPGGDSAHEKLGRSLEWVLRKYFYGFRKNPKMISSLSRQLGRDRALIESFHSVGWSKTLQDAKWMIDRLAALGINFFNVHAFFYTIDGMVKHDAPPSQFIQNPYWEHYQILANYAARISYALSQGNPACSIAVLDPTTSLWTHMGNPFKNDFSYGGYNQAEKKKLEVLKKHWADLCLELTLNNKEYDHLDPELLNNAIITDGKMKIGKAVYSIIILPPITNIEESAWKVIKKFIKQGGRVIANGLLPYEVIEGNESIIKDIHNTFQVSYQIKEDFWLSTNHQEKSKDYFKGPKHAYFIPSTAQQHIRDRSLILFNIIHKYLEDKIQFCVDDGTKSFLTHHRQLSNQSELVFIANQKAKEQSMSIIVKNDDEFICFEQFDLETGEVHQLSSVKDRNQLKLSLDFAPYQSYLIQIRKEKNNAAKEQIEAEEIVVNESSHWQMTPLQDNMLRLHEFHLTVTTESIDTSLQPTLVEAKTFIDQCEDLAQEQMLPVSFKQIFGTPMKTNISYPVDVRYETTFHIKQMPTRCYFVMDKHAILGDLHIYINEIKVEKKNFIRQFVYDHNNFITGVHSLLKEGQNTIRVVGTIQQDWQGVVDSLYLMGDFGVSFDQNQSPIIVQLPSVSKSLIGPYRELPYYAGTISFKRLFNQINLPTTEYFYLKFEGMDSFYEIAEVKVNGITLGIKAWSPYQWLGNTKILKKGENLVEIRVTNTLVGLLEGKFFDYKMHRLIDVRQCL